MSVDKVEFQPNVSVSLSAIITSSSTLAGIQQALNQINDEVDGMIDSKSLQIRE